MMLISIELQSRGSNQHRKDFSQKRVAVVTQLDLVKNKRKNAPGIYFEFPYRDKLTIGFKPLPAGAIPLCGDSTTRFPALIHSTGEGPQNSATIS
ncbi:hypothetical protein Tco_0103665 [Tanacetum coccineum]